MSLGSSSLPDAPEVSTRLPTPRASCLALTNPSKAISA